MPATAVDKGAVGVGYQGRDIGEFVDALVADGVTAVVDVRLTPISRKRGFSKRALAAALEESGIEYVHLPALGNAKDNRAGFGGSTAELAEARERYERALAERAGADEALARLAALSRFSRVGVFCFEADGERCHRQVVLNHLDRCGGAVVA
ncbi:MAG: DUF488 family protein [Nocardioidaceae bacterium]